MADRVGGLHPRRDVDRVAPHVVEESARTHHARDNWPTSQSDSQRQRIAARIFEDAGDFSHVEREGCQRLDMVGARLRHTADHHVGVAADLDLLQVVLVDQCIEVAVKLVQEED